MTASQVNRLWESFQAQGLTELSRLPSVYLSLQSIPLFQVRPVGLTCSYHTRGMRGRSFPQVLFAMAFAISIAYRGQSLPPSPVSGTSPKCARNAEIRAHHKKGESIATLSQAFGITEQRIWQILHERRK